MGTGKTRKPRKLAFVLVGLVVLAVAAAIVIPRYIQHEREQQSAAALGRTFCLLSRCRSLLAQHPDLDLAEYERALNGFEEASGRRPEARVRELEEILSDLRSKTYRAAAGEPSGAPPAAGEYKTFTPSGFKSFLLSHAYRDTNPITEPPSITGDPGADSRLRRIAERRGMSSEDLYGAYFSMYVERDVRRLVNVKDFTKFETFIRLLAGRVDRLVNLSSQAGDVGVSSTTFGGWLSALEALFVVVRLHPYHTNVGKRLVKTPRLYFAEPGLLTWLLQIETPEQVSRDPLLGDIFENVVAIEAVKAAYNRGQPPRLSFDRDKSGIEIDLIREYQRRPLAMEIKAWDQAGSICGDSKAAVRRGLEA